MPERRTPRHEKGRRRPALPEEHFFDYRAHLAAHDDEPDEISTEGIFVNNSGKESGGRYFSDLLHIPDSGPDAHLLGMSSNVSGTGAAVVALSNADPQFNPGVWNISTGTTTTGYASYQTTPTTDNLASIEDGITYHIAARLGLVNLSTAGEAYTFQTGFGDWTGLGLVDATDGAAYFTYTHSINSGRWQAISRDDAGTATTTDTGITADALAATTGMHWFEVVLTTTAVRFYIDAALVATHTTNIPTAVRMALGVVLKSAGTTNRNTRADAWFFEYERGSDMVPRWSGSGMGETLF